MAQKFPQGYMGHHAQPERIAHADLLTHTYVFELR